jgi:hypothetical protein
MNATTSLALATVSSDGRAVGGSHVPDTARRRQGTRNSCRPLAVPAAKRDVAGIASRDGFSTGLTYVFRAFEVP